MKKLSKTAVDLVIHVTIVYGFNKYLERRKISKRYSERVFSYEHVTIGLR